MFRLSRVFFAFCAFFPTVDAVAQYDFLPQVGIKEFATYQQTSVDSVDLGTGNVNVHIPLIAFPQKGGKLRLSFMIRYNEPQWSFGSGAIGTNSNGLITSGNWGITNNQGYTARPLGVDVVRDQGITGTQMVTERHGVTAINGDDTPYWSTTYGVRDRTGAEHLVGTNPGLGGGTDTWALSPDGSGWLPIYTIAGNTYQVSGYHDKDGLTYTSYHPSGLPGNLPAWNISDAHGNTITTAADGWHDTLGRTIPGSWTGYGSGSINDPSNQIGPIDTDPFPGIPSSETSRCGNGAIGTRTWAVPSSNDSGGSETYYFCYSQFQAHTHFNFKGPLKGIQIAYADEASFSAVLLTKIILPNSTSYSFQYDPDFLDLTRIDLPTGGFITYTWSSVKWDYCSTGLPMKRVVSQRTLNVGGGSPNSTWSYNWGKAGVCDPNPGTSIAVIVTYPDGHDEWHPAAALDPSTGLIRDVYSYRGLTNGDPANATGSLLKKVETTSIAKQSIFYMSNPESAVTDPATGTASWIAGNSIKEYFPGPVEKTVITLYDPSTNQIQSSQEIDTQSLPSSGALDRWNPDNLANPNNSHDVCACLNYSEIKTARVYDAVQGGSTGPGALLRRTETTFRFQDDGGSSYSDKGLTGLPSQVQIFDGSGNLAAQTHYTYDDTNHSAGVIAGELTAVRNWKDATTYYDTTTSFNSEGTWIGASDARGIQSHANTFDCSNTFPSSVTKAYGTSIAETFVYSHDCNTGKVVSYIDPNSKTTTYNYADPLNRIKSVSYPDGGHTGINYADGPNSSATITVDTGGPQGTMSQTVRYDLVGRTTQIQQSAGGDTISVDTRYDAMGHVHTTSNPYSNSAASSSDITTTEFDELERPFRKTNPDGSMQMAAYSGNIVTTTDETGNVWQRTTDGLGRMTKVVEPNGAITNYNYTARGELSSVGQAGLTGDVARNRSFTYDWLSRLITATNPETGTICYGVWNGSTCINGYDANGNLANLTDARNINTNYTYDALNRLTFKHYTDGESLVGYGYDGKDENGGTLSTPSANAVGRMSHSSNEQNAASNYSYDAMGRVVRQNSCIPSNCSYGVQVSASYDLAGNMTALTYPDGRQISQTFDSAGRVNSINYSNWNGVGKSYSYLSSPTYNPAGLLTGAVMGNGVGMAASYNNRSQIQMIGYGTSAQLLWGKQYQWTPNGNLQMITDIFSGSQRQFGYDNLNRLTSAQDLIGTSVGANPTPYSVGVGGTTPSSTASASSPLIWTDPDESNYLMNGDVVGAAGWEYGNITVAGSIQAPDGTSTASSLTAASGSTDSYISAKASNQYLYDNETMTGSVWLRVPSGSQTINIYLVELGSAGYDIPASKSILVTSTWQQFTLSGQYHFGHDRILFQIGGAGSLTSGQVLQIWGTKLEDTGVSGKSITNYAHYSQRLSGGHWGFQLSAPVDNSTIAPDGTTTAATITASSISNDSWAVNDLPNPAPFSGLAITGSIWLRSPGGSQAISIALINVGQGGGSPLVIQTVTATTTWQRFALSGINQQTLSTLQLQIGGSGTFGSGRSIQVWGAQIELAPSAGPYVATGDAPASIGMNLTNVLPYSQQPGAPGWAAASVSSIVNSIQAPDGSMTASAEVAGAADSYITDDVLHPTLYNNATVTGSIYLRVPTGAATVKVSVFGETLSGRTYLGNQVVSLTTSWKRFSMTGQLPNGLSRVAIQVGGDGSFTSGQILDLWGAQLELASTAGPYVATSAIPVTSGQDLTNVLQSSEQVNGPGWGIANGTLTVNSATAPDGTTTGATITANSSDSYVLASVPNPSLYDNETVTGSIYLKVGGGTQNLNLYLVNLGDSGWSNPASTSVTLTSNWQRFSVTGTNVNGLSQLSLQVGGGGSFTVGKNIQMWGAQMVIGSVAAPYEPTTTGTTNIVTGQPGTLVQNGLNQVYSYDSFGNILQNGSFNSTYTANNQMFGYSYDAAGDLLSNGIVAMAWTAEHRLASAGGATYIYDGEGNRVSKQGVGTTDTVFFNGRPIARYNAGQWTDLIYGPNGLLAEVEGTENAEPVYRVLDHLGTEVGTVTSNHILTNPLDYAPFGQVIAGNTNDPYLFTGKERDTESGLDYFGARYYASSMGRWMSPDWAEKPEAVPYSSLENPQSLNLYGYVGNNPLSHADADGHCDANGQNCSTWDHIAGAVGGVLNIVPQSINLINSLGNAALSLTSTSYRIPMLDEIQPDTHASMGGLTTGAAAQILVPVGDIGKGAQILENAAKGAASEARVLADLGVAKNTEAVVGSEGRSIPDFQTTTTVGEVKDVQTVSNTRQLRIQKDAALDSGRQHELHTGTNTTITSNAANGTTVVRRPDLGPQ